MDLIKHPAASMHWIAAASLILVGCATVAPVEYPQDHPANPAAPAAPAAPSLSALATYNSFDSTAKPDASGKTGAGEVPKTNQPGQEGEHEHHH